MKVLFISWRHDALVGGVQVTTHQLALALMDRGHEVSVLSTSAGRRRSDTSFGYPTLRPRRREAGAATAMRDLSPDVVVVNGYAAWSRPWARSVLEGLGRDHPTLLYLHDFGCADLPRDSALRIDRVVAVSDAVRGAVDNAAIGVDDINPPVDADLYRTTTARRVALFVNPVPKKGVELATELARARPDIPFAFVRAWPVGWRTLRRLRRSLRRCGNVELRASTPEPARLYGDARVLLVPSRDPEPWGRVAAEAQCSGIPVLASDAGGLPEVVGDGGLLVRSDGGVAAWSEALSRLWDDASAYDEYVKRAERHSHSPRWHPDDVAARFESSLEAARS